MLSLRSYLQRTGVVILLTKTDTSSRCNLYRVSLESVSAENQVYVGPYYPHCLVFHSSAFCTRLPEILGRDYGR